MGTLELGNALESSGNMHNPAVNLLTEPLAVAIKQSQFVKPLLVRDHNTDGWRFIPVAGKVGNDYLKDPL